MFNNLKLHKILEYSFLGIFFLYIIGGAILRAIIEAKFGVIIMLHFHVPLALLLTVEAILFFATAFTKYLDDQKQLRTNGGISNAEQNMKTTPDPDHLKIQEETPANQENQEETHVDQKNQEETPVSNMKSIQVT